MIGISHLTLGLAQVWSKIIRPREDQENKDLAEVIDESVEVAEGKDRLVLARDDPREL